MNVESRDAYSALRRRRVERLFSLEDRRRLVLLMLGRGRRRRNRKWSRRQIAGAADAASIEYVQHLFDVLQIVIGGGDTSRRSRRGRSGSGSGGGGGSGRGAGSSVKVRRNWSPER